MEGKRTKLLNLLHSISLEANNILTEEEISNMDFFNVEDIVLLAVENVIKTQSYHTGNTSQLVAEINKEDVQFLIDDELAVRLYNPNGDENEDEN